MDTALFITQKLRDTSRSAYFENISWWDAVRVRSARFLVIGAGALGNEVVKNLALLDARHISIVDFDHIERSNLTRSVLFREEDIGKAKADVVAQRAQEINPDLDIQPYTCDLIYELGLGLFYDADVIICCVDNRLARLFINRYSFLFDKVWINGAIENLMGAVEVYSRTTNCYESNLTDQEWQNIRFRLGCADVARRSESMGRIPTTPIAASIVGAWQVQEALKVIHGFDKQTLYDDSLFIEGMSNTILTLKNKTPKETLSSTSADTVYYLPFDYTCSLGEVLDWVVAEHHASAPTLLCRHEIVIEAVGRESEVKLTGPVPAYLLASRFEGFDGAIKGEDLYIIEQTSRCSLDSPLREYPLRSLGIPDNDVITIVVHGRSTYYRLAASGTVSDSVVQFKMNLTVKIVPTLSEVHVEVFSHDTLQQVMQKLIDTNREIITSSQVTPVFYSMLRLDGNHPYNLYQTVEAAGLTDGDTILLTPKTEGESPLKGNPIYYTDHTAAIDK